MINHPRKRDMPDNGTTVDNKRLFLSGDMTMKCKIKSKLLGCLYIILVLMWGTLIFLNPAAFGQATITMEEINPHVQKGEYDKALSLLKKYNLENPDKPDGWLLMGRVYLAIGGYNNRDNAEKAFKQGLQIDPRNTTLLQFVADMEGDKGAQNNAAYYLERSARVDPADPETLDRLLANYQETGFRQGLIGLQSMLERWQRAFPDSVRGYISLSKLYLVLEKEEEAISILKAALNKGINDPLLHRHLALAYLQSGNAVLFTEEYYRWLEIVEFDPELQKEFQLAGFAMSETEELEFQKVQFNKRAKELLKFWRSKDPIPTTIGNERLVEHYDRIYYSKKRFGAAISPLGFDDRGKVYIRWGPPEERHADPMPSFVPNFNIRVDGDYRKRQYSEAGADDRAAGQPRELDSNPDYASPMIRGNESWYYPSINYYLGFDFVNFGGYYREVTSLFEAVPGAVPSTSAVFLPNSIDGFMDMFMVQQFYRDRSYMGGFYAQMANSSTEQFAQDIALRIPGEKLNALLHSAPRYNVSLDLPPLKFEFYPTQFRGDNGRTRVDVAYGVKLDQFIPRPRHDTTFTFLLQNDLAFFDSLHARVSHEQFYQLSAAYPPNFDYTTRTMTGERSGLLNPGKHSLSLQILELTNNKGSFNRDECTIRDFSGDDLMMSDIKLSPSIKVLDAGNNEGEEKLQVMAYPYRQISRGMPLYVYFEIYNFAVTPEGTTNYEISFAMERRLKKEEYVAEAIRSFGRIFTGGKPQRIETSYRRQGNSRETKEWVELDISELNQAHARLTITVKDLNMTKEVKNSIEFELKERK